MSVLETFYILFKSDADKAADGLKKVDQSADRAETSLKAADRATKGTATSATAAAASTGKLAGATAVADANAKRLAASFLLVAKAAAAPLLGLLTATGLANIATGRAEHIRELDQFSAKLNSTIGDVDAFQRSVQGMGGEGSKALDSLVKIGEKVNEAFADSESGARKDFEAWGLAFKDQEGNALGATDAMLALAASVEEVSRAEGLARIKKLGIEDAATIELILKGRSAVEGYMTTQKELGVVTEEQAEITREYYAALGTLGNQMTSFGNGIAATVLPVLTSLLEGLSGLATWVSENQTLVEGFMIGVAGAITAWLLPAMVRLAIAVAIATWPFLLMAAAVLAVGAAFALAYEDFKAWQDGQGSVLGELLGDYETFVAKVQALLDSLTWENFLKGPREAAEIIQNAIASIPGFNGGAIAPEQAYTGGSDPEAAADYLRSMQNGGTTGQAAPANDLSTYLDAAANPYGGQAAPAGFATGRGMLQDATNAPPGLVAPVTNNTTTTVNVGAVTVNTQATDAEGVARAVDGALKRELANTAAGFDDGVDR